MKAQVAKLEQTEADDQTNVNKATDAVDHAEDLEKVQEYYYNSKLNELNSKISAYQSQVSTSESAVEEAKRRAESVYSKISEANSEIEDAVSKYYDAEDVYLAAEAAKLAAQAVGTISSDGYNFAMQQYRTELQLQRSIDDALVELRARAIADGVAEQTQKELVAMQFDNAKDAALAAIDKELQEQDEQMRKSQIRATKSGILAGMRITEGSAVQAGSVVTNVKPFLNSSQIYDSDTVISYVPVSEGRKIKEGMEVNVYPSTVNKNEYGHMKGKVTEVAEYVTSKDDISNELGDASLVDSFLKNGPVVAVTIELEMDPSTVSGYYWTNKKGAEVELDAGTVVTTDTIIEKKAPISMLIPYINGNN